MTVNGDQIIVLGRRQLYMLPTRFGLLFALLLLVQLLAAINYGNGLAYALTFLLGSIAVVSMLYTHRNLVGLRLAAGSCTPVFAGDNAVFRIHLVNEAVIPRFSVVMMHGKQEVARVDISAHGSAGVELPVVAEKRGYLAAPAVSVLTRFPLGLLYSWSRRVEPQYSCLVYPRPADPTPFHGGAMETPEAAPGIKSGGDDFIGVREFQPGDSPRHVDWRAVARGEGWHTKQFGGGCQATVWLDWDTLEGLGAEERLSVLTRWVLDAERDELLYGLRLPDKIIAPANGEHHENSCLRALALFGLES